jgi:hypothetical protein
MANNTLAIGALADDLGYGFIVVDTNATVGAFAVQGTPTLEPATWQYYALVVLSALLLRARLRPQFRALPQPIIDEPH